MNKWMDRLLILFAFGAFFALFIFAGCASKASPAQPTVVQKPTVQKPRFSVPVQIISNYPLPDDTDHMVKYFIYRTNGFCKEKNKPGVERLKVYYLGERSWHVSYLCKEPKNSTIKRCTLEEKYCQKRS